MRLWPKRRSEPHPTDYLTDDVEVHDLSGGVTMGDDAPQVRTPEGPDERAARLATDMAAIAADLDRKYGGPSADDVADATADNAPAAGGDNPAGGGDDEWDHLDLLSEGADESNGPEAHDGDAAVGDVADGNEGPAAPMAAPEAADLDGFDPDGFPTGPMPAVDADTPDVSADEVMFDLAPDSAGVDASTGDEEPDLYEEKPSTETGDFHSDLAVLFGPDADSAETAAPNVPAEDGHDEESAGAVETPGASTVGADEDKAEDEVVLTPPNGGFIISGPSGAAASEEVAAEVAADTAGASPAAEDVDLAADLNAQADVPAVGAQISPVALPSEMDAAQERAVAGDLAQLADEMVASVLTMKSGLLEEQEKQEAARAQIPQLVVDAVAAQATRMRGDLDAHQRDLEAGVGIAAELATLHVQATDTMVDVAALAERAERGVEAAEAIGRTNAAHEATLTAIATQARELLGEISQMHATVRGDVRTIGAQAAVAAQQRAQISAAAEWAADAPDVIAEHVLARTDEMRELDTVRAGLDQTGDRLEHLLADAEGRISTIEGDATATLGAANSLVEDIRASAATAAENVGQIAVRAAEDATELRDTFTEVMDATLEEMRAHADAARAAADQARAGAVSLSDGIRELVRQEVRAQLAATTSGSDGTAEAAPPAAAVASAESDAERWARLKGRLKALRPRLSAEVVSDMTPERSAKVRAAIADLHGASTREELSVAVAAAERLFGDD